MIIGGLQTGNTRWLAAHLQNAADNESIDLVEVTGTIARDIDGALVEFDAYTAGTRATEGVYACFINPPEPLNPAGNVPSAVAQQSWRPRVAVERQRGCLRILELQRGRGTFATNGASRF